MAQLAGGTPVDRDQRFTFGLFTLDEGSRHLGLPASTLRNWTERVAGPAQLVHRVQPAAPDDASLPFIGVVEAHMLRGFQQLGLTPAGLQTAVTRLRSQTGDEYALATRRVATDGVNLLADMARMHVTLKWKAASIPHTSIAAVIDQYLKLISWRSGDPYPVRLTLSAYQGANVIIDPSFAFGQPVLEREKVRVEDILDAFWAGESYITIAGEFGVSTDAVEAVIRSATRPVAG